MKLLSATVDAELVARRAAADKATSELARRFGLLDEQDGGGAP
jgi:hypothetical protein